MSKERGEVSHPMSTNHLLYTAHLPPMNHSSESNGPSESSFVIIPHTNTILINTISSHCLTSQQPRPISSLYKSIPPPFQNLSSPTPHVPMCPVVCLTKSFPHSQWQYLYTISNQYSQLELWQCLPQSCKVSRVLLSMVLACRDTDHRTLWLLVTDLQKALVPRSKNLMLSNIWRIAASSSLFECPWYSLIGICQHH